MISTTQQQEDDWRKTLERIGEAAVRSDIQHRGGVGIGFSNGAMLTVASEWLREKEQQRERRERLALLYTRWTLIAAIAAVLVGLAGLIATILLGR